MPGVTVGPVISLHRRPRNPGTSLRIRDQCPPPISLVFETIYRRYPMNVASQVLEPYMSSLSSATTMPLSSRLQTVNDNSDQDIQRQLEEFNRSVTIIFWYKANMEPIRLQQSIRTFPYFQLSRLGSLTNELGLSSSSYLDTYIPQSGKWEQHTISTVRLVESQQRLLYRIRKNLLEGLNEAECLGLEEEVDMQVKPLHRPSTATSSNGLEGALKVTTSPPMRKRSRDDTSPPKPPSLKRPAMDNGDATHPQKVRVTEGYYSVHNGITSNGVTAPSSSTPVAGPSSAIQRASSADTNSQHTQQHQHHQHSHPQQHTQHNQHPQHPQHQQHQQQPQPQQQQPQPQHTQQQRVQQQQPVHQQQQPQPQHTHQHQQQQQPQQQPQQQDYIYQPPPSFYSGTSPTTTPLPTYLTNPVAAAPPIPYHPHPPLKRWPNDYTVSELSAGFNAMDALIAQSPAGSSMTQRAAFERVFGSRYVKSTVCRHRAVWRKSHPSVREQFEAMGSDERACWGEFVRRVEGRPPGKTGQAAVDLSHSTVMMYHPTPTSAGSMLGDGLSRQALGDEEDGVEEPVMDSLQGPQGPSSGNVTMQSSMNVYDPALNQLSGTART